ncbi:MAG: hypothetical protein ABSF38_20425 [Verrucomicrobiota bacterium]
MRMVIGILCAAALLCGCATSKAPAAKSTAKPPAGKTIITPDLLPAGHVALVNTEARFVIINYPPGAAPKPGQRLNVYRNGLKVGEIKVTGPERDNNTVADILVGDVQLHDQTRQE